MTTVISEADFACDLIRRNTRLGMDYFRAVLNHLDFLEEIDDKLLY